MHYYRFNIGDYASHTAHLEPLEDLAYRRMIDVYFLNECPLPEKPEEVARLIRMRTHCDLIANVLREFFTLIDGEWRHGRIDADIDAFRAKSDKAKKSAEARWRNHAENDDANALRPQSECNANHKPITNNHKPITKKEDISKSDALDDFDVFWSAYPRKQDKKKSQSSWKRLSKTKRQLAIEDIKTRFIGVEDKYIPLPTTYLNGERWDDEKQKQQAQANNAPNQRFLN